VLVDNLAKLNSASRNGISAALVVVALVAMYTWTIAPQLAWLRAEQQYETAVSDIARKCTVTNAALRKKKTKVEELHQEFAQLQDTVFTSEAAKEFFSDLQVIAQQAGCTVDSLNLVKSQQRPQKEESEKPRGIVTSSAALSVLGTYPDIIKLIEKLQARPQKVWIDALKMKAIGGGLQQLKCDMTITICTFQDREATTHE
jgi:Tfp pilus assembly protein PilO